MLMSLVGALQRLQPRLLTGYLLQVSGDTSGDSALGNSAVVDLACLGRHQHHLCTIYTNLADVN